MTTYVIATSISLVVSAVALAALLADRAARAAAWRRIADERRWNHDRHKGQV